MEKLGDQIIIASRNKIARSKILENLVIRSGLLLSLTAQDLSAQPALASMLSKEISLVFKLTGVNGQNKTCRLIKLASDVQQLFTII